MRVRKAAVEYYVPSIGYLSVGPEEEEKRESRTK